MNLTLIKRIISLILGSTLLTLSGCTGIPEKVEPVSPFELNKYLGKWYEIARLDHSFERGLREVTATYSMREDGGVKVINAGITEEGKRKEAEGKAYFTGSSNTGALKVSFFAPFYGGYNVAKLDKDYSMSLVIGPTTGYAWILSRSKNPSKQQCQAYVEKAKEVGVVVSDLIWVQTCQ
jgi:apolipoprotein D and lipocalin family protein